MSRFSSFNVDIKYDAAEKYNIDQSEILSKTAYLTVKRISDFIFALTALIVLCIPMLIIAVVISLDSSGSPIFAQERLGKNAKPFVMYKFRSMYTDAEALGPQWAAVNDSRCTRVGRFLRKSRLDELPQLFNILKGEMSFVGPRPERKYFYDKFEEYIEDFSDRLIVVPGLTGYAQVHGGYSLQPEEKIVYDMEYIQNQSILMDLKCILLTIKVVISHDGAR